MSDKGVAFVRGGCGCLSLFLVFAFLAILAGGHAHIDIGGIITLFVIGGVIGLIFVSVYDKGRKDALSGDGSDENRPPTPAITCPICKASIPPGFNVCGNCGWKRR
jgi:hypothetical protein